MKEFKIIEVPKSNFKKLFETDFSGVEALLAQRSAEGWEVVSVCPNEYGRWNSDYPTAGAAVISRGFGKLQRAFWQWESGFRYCYESYKY